MLLIDDEPDITFIMKLGLQRQGFEVETYNDPLLFLSNAKPGSYDIAIFDIRMPKMDGFQVSHEFKKLDARARVYFLSAFDTAEDPKSKQLFGESRVSGFLKKPIGIAELVRRLNETTDRPKASNTSKN